MSTAPNSSRSAESPPPNLDDFQPPEVISDKYPQFPAPTLRWFLRQRHLNGLDAHVRRVGKKLYIHVPGFAAWIDSRPSS
jgi:hypothetical protein